FAQPLVRGGSGGDRGIGNGAGAFQIGAVAVEGVPNCRATRQGTTHHAAPKLARTLTTLLARYLFRSFRHDSRRSISRERGGLGAPNKCLCARMRRKLVRGRCDCWLSKIEQ